MKLKTSPFKFLLALLAAIAVLNSTICLSRIKLNQQQLQHDERREEQQQNNAISAEENKFKVPFVVLMASHKICVAQLPLIGEGNVSSVYRLVDDHDWSELRVADVRDFEQQMPKSSPSSILGKSQRQQIAASNSGQHSTNDREEVGKRRNEDDDVARSVVGAVTAGERSGQHEEGGPTLPRKKRSSGGGGNSLPATTTTTNDGTVNNNERDANSRGGPVQESSSATNVTSAARSTSEQEEVVRKRIRTEDDDDDVEPKNGAVHFSDFDVHMRLGMAFVADTRGRIHRFKLSGYGDGNSQQQPENDYTNNIGTGLESSSGRQPASIRESGVGAAYGLRNFSSFRDDDGLSLLGDSDDANKVGRQFGGADANFGPHPTTSGAEQSGKSGYAESGNDSSSSASNTVDGSFSTGTNYDKQSQTVINSARPRIIWSRAKHVAHHSKVAVAAQSKRTSERGALSSSEGHNLSPTTTTSNQMENSEQMENDDGESGEPLFEQSHTINVSGVGAESVDEIPTSRRQPSNDAREPRTEVAVDWLNNLLFVLDKHRLLALDYEGNNELVLIDDFNNQPVNLKADPLNGFLFWLQVGKFHNTIYKLDLNVLDRYQNGSSLGAALISHHYAHPIITNLPIHARLFIIDHKHSRIYVPLSSRHDEISSDGNRSQTIGDAEIFSTPSDESNIITHMNSSTSVANEELPNEVPSDEKSTNSNESNSMQDGQILAYNLDGTDVGPLRSPKKSSHSYNFDDILDITLDTTKGLLYWLTNEGKDIFEEYQGDSGTPYHQAQHNLEGERFRKLLHFDNDDDQPTGKPRFNLSKLFLNLASTTAANRLARSDRLNSADEQASSLSNNSNSTGLTGFSRSAVLILGGVIVASLFGIFVYFVARPAHDPDNHVDHHHNSGSSSAGSFIGESHVDSVAHTSGFIGASTISRWIPRPSTSSADTSTFHRSMAKNEPLDSCDFESSTNYDQSNAIDEHYRDSVYDQTIIQMEQNCLTNLSKWPSKMCEVSNRLYVPIELQEDETLSSIHRVSIEQLNIEKRSPLGEGHFGTVLQGTITCTMYEKGIMLNRSSTTRSAAVSMHPYAQDLETREAMRAQSLALPSSGSSGHGSSSISSEFITANSMVETTIQGDYLLPKSNEANSATSDYSNEEGLHATNEENYISNPAYYDNRVDLTRETKFKVAIKKLKENASPKERSDFLQEAKHLAKFDHPNIVSLIGICLDRGSTLIIMELMLGGDLIRYMQENKPTLDNQDKLTPEDLLSICLDIVNACCYLEEREHIHRDLAARNCLVSSRKKEDRVVKLADFGLARDIYKDSYYKKLNDSAMPLKWMAPECLMEQKFTIKSDVWSFGVVMWEVMSYCQDKPYNNVEHFMMKDHLIEGLRLGRPEHCCEDVYRLMNECWQLDPNRRPTFEECRATLIEIKSSSS